MRPVSHAWPLVWNDAGMDGLIMLGVTAVLLVGIVLKPLFPGKRRR